MINREVEIQSKGHWSSSNSCCSSPYPEAGKEKMRGKWSEGLKRREKKREGDEVKKRPGRSQNESPYWDNWESPEVSFPACKQRVRAACAVCWCSQWGLPLPARRESACVEALSRWHSVSLSCVRARLRSSPGSLSSEPVSQFLERLLTRE